MLNQEQTQLLVNLRHSPGWKVLESVIKENMDSLRAKLENDKMVVVGETQAELRAYKFVLRKVNEGVKKDA